MVNRTLVFVKKYFNNEIPDGEINEEIKDKIKKLYANIGGNIEAGNLKTAIDDIFEFIRRINKYFDEETPWITVKEDIEKCSNTIYNCLFSIINLANLLHPFLPESSEKIKKWLGINEEGWKCIYVKIKVVIGDFEILFPRLDKKLIDDELEKLTVIGND